MTDTTLSASPARLPALTAYAAPVARVLLAAIFVLSGWGKIGAYDGTAAYMASAGVPALLLPLVIAIELGGGLLLAIGWQARLAALALAGFTLVAAVLFHGNVADQMQQIMFLKNLAIAGGLLLVVANGAGALSLDGRRRG